MCVVPLTDLESSVHLFLHCDPVAQIWSWLGERGEVYQQWDTRSDVINYAVSLGSIQCKFSDCRQCHLLGCMESKKQCVL